MTVKVRFLPEDITIDVERGVTVLEAARRSSVIIESPCDGTGTCGKCAVKIKSPSYGGMEHCSSVRGGTENHYFACRTEILADIVVEKIDNNKNQQMDVLKEGHTLPVSINPFVKKKYDSKNGKTSVYAGNTIIVVEEGDTGNLSFGLVVDIGTTTLVASLIHLTTGREICSVSSLNPQSLHAQDVLSRIKFASTEEGLEFMQSIFVAELNRMIGELIMKSGIEKDNTYEVVYSGNTCMLHLACGVHPGGLGRYPYESAIRGNQYFPAPSLGLSLSEGANVYIPPVISGFVGADITSGILATGFNNQKAVTLFIDIGTNGEIVLYCNGILASTSTAAGPAFEGMNISCGMRAEQGAIAKVSINPTGDLSFNTIGNTEARGICGSGLVDIVAELIRHGLITREGRLIMPDRQSRFSPILSRIGEMNGVRTFFLTDSVFITQKDIRQVQLAKGAIRTGIEFLMKHVGTDASQVDNILVAGAFGYHSQIRNIIDIGLLPDGFREKIRLVGNTSKSGGIAYLLNGESRTYMQSTADATEVIELADCAGFERAFIGSLAFEKGITSKKRN